jgi:hypothetical protein
MLMAMEDLRNYFCCGLISELALDSFLVLVVEDLSELGIGWFSFSSFIEVSLYILVVFSFHLLCYQRTQASLADWKCRDVALIGNQLFF